MLNKKGYVLVYAIGVVSLLILLGITLTNFTSQRTFWINKSVYKVQHVSKARTEVEAIAAELAYVFEGFSNESYRYLTDLNNEHFAPVVFKNITDRYSSNPDIQVEIRNLNEVSCVYPTDNTKPPCHPVDIDSYTYAYDIIYHDKKNDVIAQQKFFLSMIPSFLYFALGSNSDMNINGGAYVYGDMYVKNNLYLADTTNFIYNDVFRQKDSTFLTVNPKSSIYLENELLSCRISLVPCYTVQETPRKYTRNIDNFLPITNSWEYQMTFVDTPPMIRTYSDRFLNVNFDDSYNFYLNDAANTDNRAFDLANLTTELRTLKLEQKLIEVSSIGEINAQALSVVMFASDTEPVINIYQNLTFDKTKWIIIDGDLNIENYAWDPITIDANFIITGNISIVGNVILNSTIYTLGEGLIHNATINKTGNNQLVLLTKGFLQFTKINQFDNDFNSRFLEPIIDPETGLVIEDTPITPDIKGFFYTEKNVQIYTISSYIAIEGGIFANDAANTDVEHPTDFINDTDSIGLLINSYRGSVDYDQINDQIIFHPPLNYKQSRFVIKHSTNVILDQPKGLPLNKNLNYLFEGVTVK